MSIRNLTPHVIKLNSGKEFPPPPPGDEARIKAYYTPFDENGVCQVMFGEPENVPEPDTDTLYVVSGMVSAAMPDRHDVVSPATGHPDCVRENGQVVSVPGFVKSLT